MGHTVSITHCVTMHHYILPLLPLLLATLAQSNLLSSLSSLSSNSDACWDFTVGSCETDTNGLVDFYPDINDGGVCELLCYTRDGCNYFRWSKSSQECKLYTFLDQHCNIIGGARSPEIEDCLQGEKPVKDFLLREDCVYQGVEVLRTPGVPFSALCQDLLTVQGSILKAVYFSYSKDSQECVMYTSMGMECDIIGGPKPGPGKYRGTQTWGGEI